MTDESTPLERVAAAQERIDRELEQTLTPEALERLRDAEAKLMDSVLYGVSFEDADGRRIDPRIVVGFDGGRRDDAAAILPGLPGGEPLYTRHTP